LRAVKEGQRRHPSRRTGRACPARLALAGGLLAPRPGLGHLGGALTPASPPGSGALVTVWNVDIMWAMMLFGITLFLGCFIVTNRAMRGMRIVGLVTSYAIGVWMFIALPWRVAATTWCMIAAACGFVVFAYERIG
jgi:hypothetical protein